MIAAKDHRLKLLDGLALEVARLLEVKAVFNAVELLIMLDCLVAGVGLLTRAAARLAALSPLASRRPALRTKMASDQP